MSTIHFVALVTGGQAAGYRATLPDIHKAGDGPMGGDGVVEGRDLGELLAKARRLASDHLQALAEAGEPWPTPTPLEAIVAPPGAVAVVVDVVAGDPPVRVNISIGEQLLQRLDAAAETRGMTRSGFIAQSVRLSLGERERGDADFDAATRRLQDELSALGRRINDSIGPDSSFGRRMSELDDRVYEGVRKAADSVSAAMTRRREASRAAGRNPDPADAAREAPRDAFREAPRDTSRDAPRDAP